MMWDGFWETLYLCFVVGFRLREFLDLGFRILKERVRFKDL
jgi:hypothetical protein